MPPLPPSEVTTEPSLVRGISQNVFLLSVVSLFNDISSEMLYPLIPLFLTTSLGAPVAVVGLIEGAAEMTASLLKGVSGWLSDRWGRRLPLVIGGYGCSAAAKPLIALATGWPLVMFSRLLDRFGKGIRNTARDALIAESSGQEERGRAFGFHRSVDQLGAVIGPLLALPLLTFFAGNYRALFLFAAIPGLIATLTLLRVRETGHAVSGAPPPPSFKWSQTTPRFRIFLAITLLFALGNSSDVFLILRAKQLHLNDHSVFLVFALYNFVTVLSAYPAGTLSDRLGRKGLLTTSFLIFALVYAGFGLASSPLHIWLLFALYGLQVGISEGISKAYAVDLIPVEFKATALGLQATATGITTFAASGIAGLLWSGAGAPVVFYYGAATALLSAVLLGVAMRSPRPDLVPLNK